MIHPWSVTAYSLGKESVRGHCCKVFKSKIQLNCELAQAEQIIFIAGGAVASLPNMNYAPWSKESNLSGDTNFTLNPNRNIKVTCGKDEVSGTMKINGVDHQFKSTTDGLWIDQKHKVVTSTKTITGVNLVEKALMNPLFCNQAYRQLGSSTGSDARSSYANGDLSGGYRLVPCNYLIRDFLQFQKPQQRQKIIKKCENMSANKQLFCNESYVPRSRSDSVVVSRQDLCFSDLHFDSEQDQKVHGRAISFKDCLAASLEGKSISGLEINVSNCKDDQCSPTSLNSLFPGISPDDGALKVGEAVLEQKKKAVDMIADELANQDKKISDLQKDFSNNSGNPRRLILGLTKGSRGEYLVDDVPNLTSVSAKDLMSYAKKMQQPYQKREEIDSRPQAARLAQAAAVTELNRRTTAGDERQKAAKVKAETELMQAVLLGQALEKACRSNPARVEALKNGVTLDAPEAAR